MLEATVTNAMSMNPDVDYWAVRLSNESIEGIAVRQGMLQPIVNQHKAGALVTVIDRGGLGYCATNDFSISGMRAAIERARAWARRTANRNLISTANLPRTCHKGNYRTPMEQPWEQVSLGTKIGLLQELTERLKNHERIVDWEASLTHKKAEMLLMNSAGARIEQTFHFIVPELYAVANEGGHSQRRTFGRTESARQGGLELLEDINLSYHATRVADEALTLLHAPNCPAANLDLLLMPSQMVLQIHESIGHPLELDRILGDERNYAGGSFVTLDMFGTYRYGSDVLNVVFDPTQSQELASYAYDDEGLPAARQYIIRRGILERPLGGACSQARAGMDGVANARASSWHRPPIDRIANLNLEPGDKDLKALISTIEEGILMDTNRSWSIDDSRNKFQFGCEYGRYIRDGQLGEVVRNPNYRGISSRFWRDLTHVGDPSTYQVQGLFTCGKGEPNQMIHVGHASPACVFRGIDVFGGA